MAQPKVIYYCVDSNGKVVSNPYWDKNEVIIHMEEIKFPYMWKKLRDRMGYRIEKLYLSAFKKK